MTTFSPVSPRAAGPLRALTAVAALLLGAGTAAGQLSGPWNLNGGLPVGSEQETYLRDLQDAGLAPLYPWTVRGFTYGELKHIVPADTTPHPWQGQFDLSAPPTSGFHMGWVTPEATLYANSGYPFGKNDGMVWAGRGFTTDVKGGFWLTWGRLHFRFAPEAFLAQNASFPLAPNGQPPGSAGALRDSRFPGDIDLPQRFGRSAYGRVGAGSSELTVTLPGVVIGISGAGQVWGPGDRYSLLLSDNAGGFDHVFLQTSRPLSIGIGRIHGRFEAGRLGQSKWSPDPQGTPDRFASAVIVGFIPRGVPGLDVGVERFVDANWAGAGTIRQEIFRPLGGILSVGRSNNLVNEDQEAGAFFRWVVPRAGVEVFAEAIREDFSRSLRDLIINPDDLLGRTLGIRRVMKLAGNRLLAIRGEVVSAQYNADQRDGRYFVNHRISPLYVHSKVHQGQTQFGQLLGSPAAYGGSGWTVGADLYGPRGRLSAELFYQERGDWLSGTVDGTGVPDVIYGVGLEAVRFHKGWDLSASVRPSIDLNRNVQSGNDVFNLNVVLGVRGLPW